ncbi:uncharacterized protein LOC100382297 [Zea mays]|uniref:Glycine-rich protein n=1 Tax=Zea mays TaxID=4577 RepID=C0P680_MAIZE|nr:uncharacterized protein LOC100382297 [Zea mays]ACN28496.1 unknown [Zea mays]AQK63779.1 hypothetical protein ZEAMMB73_Zm00001d013528 [Zea mays]|eukprot:NP_001168517.1 uncharacterized protein LOC100382297 [Zea mays]
MSTSPAASSSAPTAFAASAVTMAAEAADGPVLSVVSKRLRALRKKYNRITQMEESLAAGKSLNREQEEVLRSKPVVAALIDELERLRPPLASALAEELSSRSAPAPAATASSSDSDSSVQDLLALVYFGSLFDVKQQSDFVSLVYTRELERSSCLTYDYVGDDPEDSLVETDLNAVSALATLAASRPPAAAGVSHRDALQACAHHARLWLSRADEPIHPDSTITYAGVRAKLDRIMASGYYTAQLEMRTPMDLAAAVANFGAGGVQVQESMVVSPQALEAVEESQDVEEHKDEKEDSEATEIYSEHQAPVVDAEHVDDEGLVNPADEVPSAEAEQETLDDYVDDQEQKDQQFTQRRSYQNQRSGGGRGGGRRGYPNGRGVRGYQNGRGGGYQNGRGGGGYQNGRGGGGGYYESGYYQPRNYNNRGRGGRNSYYNNHGGGAQAGGHGHPGRVELGANA